MDKFKRVYFTEMPMDICKAVVVGKLIFLSGMEGVDFDKGLSVADDVMEQTEVAVRKIHNTLKELGLSIGNMVKHTIYLKKGAADPIAIIQKFHAESQKYAPELKKKPSTGTIVVIDGLATEALKIEIDSVAAYPD
jgi:enamine deaminase RidA (YjgF/YER057c/UK114 family)